MCITTLPRHLPQESLQVLVAGARQGVQVLDLAHDITISDLPPRARPARSSFRRSLMCAMRHGSRNSPLLPPARLISIPFHTLQPGDPMMAA